MEREQQIKLRPELLLKHSKLRQFLQLHTKHQLYECMRADFRCFFCCLFVISLDIFIYEMKKYKQKKNTIKATDNEQNLRL